MKTREFFLFKTSKQLDDYTAYSRITGPDFNEYKSKFNKIKSIFF